MVDRVVIHGGMHKTGSSSLQFALKDSPHVVRLFNGDTQLMRHDMSCFLVILDKDERSQYFITRHPDILEIDDVDAFAQHTRFELEEQLKLRDGTLFMSGEAFLDLRPVHIERLVNYLQQWVGQVEFVFYVRKPNSYAKSMQAQLWENGLDVTPDTVSPNYHRFDHFVPYKTTMIKFESVDSVVKDFSERYGLDLVDCKFNVTPSSASNLSMKLRQSDLNWAAEFWASKISS